MVQILKFMNWSGMTIFLLLDFLQMKYFTIISMEAINRLNIIIMISRIRQAVDQLVNGFFPGVYNEFEPIFDSLLEENDQYFVLKDFASYAEIQKQLEKPLKISKIGKGSA